MTADEMAHDPRTIHQPGDIEDEPHGAGDHGEDHGHDDHAHAVEPLGPVDVQAWGAFAVGVGLGVVVALCIAASVSLPG